MKFFVAVPGVVASPPGLPAVLAEPGKRKGLFRGYWRRVNSVMAIHLRFVNAWYAGREFMEVFMNPTEILQLAPAVNSLLAGSDRQSFAVRWRMGLSY